MFSKKTSITMQLLVTVRNDCLRFMSSSVPIQAGKSTMRRHSFILIEIVVATILAGLLVTSALGLGYYCFKTARFYEKAIETEEQHMARIVTLRSILRSIQREDKDPFYVVHGHSSDHLFFTFFAGNRHEHAGSNERFGQLYVNEQQQLIFVYSTYSKKVEIDLREDQAVVLWPNVQRITFSFVIKSQQRKSIPGIESLEQGGYLSTWEKDWPELPAVIVASIYEKGKKEPTKVSSILAHSVQEIQVE